MLKTCNLSGAELDYWVAKAEGLNPVIEDGECWLYVRDNCTAPIRELSPTANWGRKGTTATRFRPSQDWPDGGPVLEKLGGTLWRGHECWVHRSLVEHTYFLITGTSPLEAAMRAYVLSKFGEEVPKCKTQ